MTQEKEFTEIMNQLQHLGNPANLPGMARFGINVTNTLGASMPELRKLARGKKDHALADQLWQTGIHEARILAGLIDDPHQVTDEQMERWAGDFDSWDVCDQVCLNLFYRTPLAIEKAVTWSERAQEYVKRAGFVLMAVLAVHAKKAGDDVFLAFLPIIQREATDERNFVKKAVNWALRQIGKRNPALRLAAIQTAIQIQGIESRSAHWIAADTLKELKSSQINRSQKISSEDKAHDH
jgi:3-methyladenine DNA glycosylase AlkD